MASEKKTGIFYAKDPKAVVVMHEGKEVFRYRSVDELVEIHMKGLAALERELDATIESQYKS